MISPDARRSSPLSGRKATYRPVQIPRASSIGDAEIAAAKNANALEFGFDAILVDEAQDWPQPEADLLSRLYGGNAISLADGMSQLVRGSPTNWKGSVVGQTKVGSRHLDAGLRMKSSLCNFANAFAEEAGLPWHVAPNTKAAGGRVIIVRGRYDEQTGLQKSLLAEVLKAGNMPIDMLHCVPPSAIAVDNGRRYSLLARSFLSSSWETWDGVDAAIRRNFPRSANSLRIVQYESCRGLEGWTTVLDGFDEFWKLKKADAARELLDAGSANTIDPERHAEAVAWRWCMIPITRAIDTLVIAIKDNDSIVARLLDKLSSNLPDIFEKA